MSGFESGTTTVNWSMALWTIAVAIACTVPCAVLGCYLVLRRMSLLGDAISHAVLPGIVFAFLFTGRISGAPLVVGAMILGVLTSVFTETLHRYGRVAEDASMGVVFTSLFALGVIMMSNYARQADLDPGCVLYGLIEFAWLDQVSVLGVEIPRALIRLGFAGLATAAFVALLWKELKIASFDPTLATSMGIHAGIVHYLLMAMVAGVTVAAFEAVGSILVIAMLIVPGATAHLLTDRLPWMLVWSVAVAIVAAVVGFVLADRLNTSVAGMIAVVAGAQFALAVLGAPRHGVVSKLWHNAALSIRVLSEDVLALLYRAEEAYNGPRPFPGLSRQTCLASVGRGPLALAALVRIRRKGDAAPSSDGNWQLTAAGRERARSLVRAHRLWERYLGEHFALPLDHLHEPASRIEHYIGPGLQQQIAASLEQTDLDPHGRPIPSDPSTNQP